MQVPVESPIEAQLRYEVIKKGVMMQAVESTALST
jgi:hypothetical protein